MSEALTFPLTLTHELRNIEDVRKWFDELTELFELSWHPDDNFNFLVEKTPEVIAEEARLDSLMEKAHAICEAEGVEIYDLGLEATKETRRRWGFQVEEEIPDSNVAA